jgi:hypothetical protein
MQAIKTNGRNFFIETSITEKEREMHEISLESPISR